MTLMEHHELIIHGTPPDIFEGAKSYAPAKVTVVVRCTNIFQGKPCNERLFDVDADLWDSKVINGKLKIKCDKCKNVEDFSLWH